MIVEELEGVSKSYPMVKALQGVSLKIKEKELLLIRGPSGSGKSTLMHIAGLLDLPDKGKIKIMGKPAPKNDQGRAKLRSEFMGFVFQNFALMSSLNVLDNICLPAVFRRVSLEERARELAETLNITNRLTHYPNQISGGERQRVAVARALFNSPDVIFCDEPTGNLDSATGKLITDLITKLNEEKGITFVLVTHDRSFVEMGSRTAHMVDGQIT